MVVPGLERLDLKDVGLDQIAVADGVEAAVGLLDEGAGAGQREAISSRRSASRAAFPGGGRRRDGETWRDAHFPGYNLSSKDMYSLDKYSKPKTAWSETLGTY